MFFHQSLQATCFQGRVRALCACVPSWNQKQLPLRAWCKVRCWEEETDLIKWCCPGAFVRWGRLHPGAVCSHIKGSDPAKAPHREASIFNMPLGVAVTQELSWKWLELGSIGHWQNHWDIRADKVKLHDTQGLEAYEKGIATPKNTGTNFPANKSTLRVVKKTPKQEQRPEIIPALPSACSTATWQAGLAEVGCDRGQGVRAAGMWKWLQPHRAAWAKSLIWSQHGKAVAAGCFHLLGFNVWSFFTQSEGSHTCLCYNI